MLSDFHGIAHDENFQLLALKFIAGIFNVQNGLNVDASISLVLGQKHKPQHSPHTTQ